MKLPDCQYLWTRLFYDYITGKLIWIPTSDHSAYWNKRYGYKEAFTAKHETKHQYFVGTLAGKKYYAHQIIFKMMRNEEPEEIDHIDQDKSNNVWTNLRASSRQENSCNMPLRKDNKSGFAGVHYSKGKWVSRIVRNGKEYHLGRFDTCEKAVQARAAWNPVTTLFTEVSN